MGNCRTGMGGEEAGCLVPARAPRRCCSSAEALRVSKGPPCSGSPCRAGSRCCWHSTGRGGEGAPRAAEPGSVGAADGGWGPADSGCSRCGSPRSIAASGGRTGAALGRHSLPDASYAGTTLPTAARRAAPAEGKT